MIPRTSLLFRFIIACVGMDHEFRLFLYTYIFLNWGFSVNMGILKRALTNGFLSETPDVYLATILGASSMFLEIPTELSVDWWLTLWPSRVVPGGRT